MILVTLVSVTIFLFPSLSIDDVLEVPQYGIYMLMKLQDEDLMEYMRAAYASEGYVCLRPTTFSMALTYWLFDLPICSKIGEVFVYLCPILKGVSDMKHQPNTRKLCPVCAF